MKRLSYSLVRERLSASGGRESRSALIQLDAIIDPRPRNLAIYRAAAAEYPEIEPVLEAAECGTISDSLIGTLQQEVPLHPADRAALYAFWHARYHEDSWLHYDQLYPGAKELLEQLVHDGFHLIYLCDRDGPDMAMGTRSTLRRHGLPCEPAAEFLFRPSREMPEDEFVERALRPFQKSGIELVIENRATRANRIHEILPRAMVVLIRNELPAVGRNLYPSIFTCERYAESIG